MPANAEAITALLTGAHRGDKGASNELFEAVYTDLRRLARGLMSSERADHTLQPTALVHEAYMRVFKGASVEWRNRAQFFAVAARQMRHVLVDHGREYRAQKRDGRLKMPLDNVNPAIPVSLVDIDVVEQLMNRLEQMDKAAADVVQLKFFAGLTDLEIAGFLEVSAATVRRHWLFARAWLIQQLSAEAKKG
jgi:RNA polymerase sigma-70 factor, ECF subfamily